MKAPRADSNSRLNYDNLSPSTKLLKYNSRDKKERPQSSLENSAASNRSRKEEKVLFEPKPIRLLEAPRLIDDYYLNLLEWGASGYIGIGLEDSVHLYNFKTGETSMLLNCNKVVPQSNDSLSCSNIDQVTNEAREPNLHLIHTPPRA